MPVAPHDRTLYHTGTEDDSTLVLSAAIGRYAAGMTVHDVLVDFAARLTFEEEVGCDTRVFALTADAQIVRTTSASFTADASIRDPAKEFTANAVIVKSQAISFSANAMLIERQAGYTTLNGAINASQTTITVTSSDSFPTVGNYIINIGSEQLEVTGGQGTLVWTVIRGVNGTTAAPHGNGTAVIEEC